MRTMNEILDGDWTHEIQPASLNGRLLGRGTLRRGATGPTAVRIPAWGFAFQPKTPGSRLERAYVDALSTLDEFEDLAATARKSGKIHGRRYRPGNRAARAGKIDPGFA